jgi:hypothetical protein
MEKATDISTKTLMPVFDVSGCCGHILRTAKGFKACDANDRLIGIFETPRVSDIFAGFGAETCAVAPLLQAVKFVLGVAVASPARGNLRSCGLPYPGPRLAGLPHARCTRRRA